MRQRRAGALSAALALALLSTGLAAAQVGVLRTGSYYQSIEPGGQPTILAPRAAVQAPPLFPAAAASLRATPEECSLDCRRTEGCSWFEYCSEQVSECTRGAKNV